MSSRVTYLFDRGDGDIFHLVVAPIVYPGFRAPVVFFVVVPFVG